VPCWSAPLPDDRPGVAAFDFDGTLARRDALLPFLLRLHGPTRVATAFVRGVARHGLARDRVKVVVLRELFRGYPAAALEREGETFAGGLAARVKPEMRERLAWHQRSGHRIVIISASLGAYLRPLGAELGVDGVIAVELLADGGILTGEIDGINVRGAEKLARLRAWVDDADVELWAYGDSSGDEHLLAAAHHPTWVGRRGRRATSAASSRRRRRG
jgi:phosphatidylglycerophosphatase C